MILEFEDVMGERRAQSKMHLLVECPTADCECPYWSWKYHKCAMMARGEGDPRKECDNYWDDEELDMAQRLWNLEADESEWEDEENE